MGITRQIGLCVWCVRSAALLAGCLALLTAVVPSWIEAVLGVDPDSGNGGLEWSLVALLAVVSLCLGLAGEREARRLRGVVVTSD